MRKKITLFLIVFSSFYLISTVFAIEEINIEPGSLKQTTFEIRNNNPISLRYTIYSAGWNPWILFSYSQILLKPGESKNVTVFLVPNRYAEGVYEIFLIAESRVDRQIKKLKVTISKGTEKKAPEIKEFFFDGKKLNLIINSEEEFDLEISIYRDAMPLFKIKKKIEKGENIINNTFNFSTGLYQASLDFYKNGKLLYSFSKSYSVSGITKNKIIEKKEKWNYFILSGTKIIFENKGEKAEKKIYTLYVDKSVDSFFSSKDYKEKIDEGNRYKYLWEFVLLPNQKYVIIYSYNYSVIFILSLALIFFAFLFYSSNKKEIKVKKYIANNVWKIKEGKEIKICLEVINKTKQEINGIVLEDFIQPIFKLKNEFEGVKPDKILKIKSEEKLVWEIPRMEPKEMRIFIYKIVPKVGLNEKYSFSLAKAKYKKDQITKVVFSNLLTTRD